ncbi:MAG: rhomboid family intramembrane serine protease [Myxococcota bacterium]
MIPLRDRLPTRTTPVVNYVLLGLNVLAFLWQVASQEVGYVRLTLDWGFVPARFLADPIVQVLTIFTAMFLHGGWLHIGGNMLFLWVFGDNVEDAIGHVRYVLFYFAGGLLAALAQLAVDPSSTIPMVGASGAIAAVLAGYVSLYPRARVLVLMPIFVIFLFFEFPAWLVMLEWFALNLLQGLTAFAGGGQHGGVAWFAHIGGFLAGLILIRIGMIGRQRIDYEPWRGWRAPPRRRQPRVTYRGRGGTWRY